MNLIESLSHGFIIGMHGGGEIFGHQKTNSKEAINKWLTRGVKFFEFDVSETIDHKYVAFAHRLDSVYLDMVELSYPAGGCTQEWFLSKKLYPCSTCGLTPVSLNEVIELLKSDSSVILMFDLFAASKEEIARFARYLSANGGDNLLSRILVEIYDIKSCRILKEVNPNINLIYGVQPNSDMWPCDDEKKGLNLSFINALKELKIHFISFQWHYLEVCPDGISSLLANDFCVLSHSDNDSNVAQYTKEGVSILLVDYYFGNKRTLITKTIRCISRNTARIRILIAKIKRAGLQGTIKKVASRLK